MFLLPSEQGPVPAGLVSACWQYFPLGHALHAALLCELLFSL